MTRTPRRGRGGEGFTLIELILAAFISMLVIAGIYIVYAGHSRVFATQRAVSESQAQARFAMEMVKADLQRAGFMVPADTSLPETRQIMCGVPDPGTIGDLLAVTHQQGAGWAHLPGTNLTADPAASPPQAPDTLVLVGNYLNSDIYWVDNRRGNTFVLQDTTTFDSTDPFPSASSDDFDHVFPPNRTAVRVLYQGKVFISRVTASSFAAKQVTVATNPPCGSDGVWDGWAQMNVLHKVRYRVVQAAAEGRLSPEEATLTGGVDTAAQYVKARSVLVREFLSWNDGAVLSAETVAENVVDFQVWFLFDNPAQLATLRPAVDPRGFPFPDSATGGAPCGNQPLGSASCRISNIQGAVVRLSVRTEREDPSFIHPGGRRGLTWYEVLPGATGAARVRTLVSQVDLPNIRFGQGGTP